jgi:UDP-N-acetylmuramoyl-tripeptide--D-alanyl-D-alanine ligase
VLHDGEHEGEVATDTRALPPGAWFVALVGERFDAHAFAAQARAAGAGGGVFQRLPEGWSGPWVEVADTTRALQDLGRHARSRLRVPVVGLTGSSGKTTTRRLIACALAQLGPVHQTTGNLNNHLGVPLTLLATPDGAAAAVVEMGTSAPGEIRFLAELGVPDVRVIVNVGPAHLEELGGLEGVAREKGALFDTARPGDVCVVNADDPFLRDRAVPGRRLTWGAAEGADVRLLDVTVDAEGWRTVARYATPAGVVEATIPTPGTHVAHDAGAALAVAVALGLDVRRAAADLAAYEPVGMRMRPESLPGGVVAINDAYNANPASTKASLDTLASMPGRRVAVLGDMLELGAGEAAFHREVAAHAAGLGLDLVVLVGPRMAAAADAAPGAWVDATTEAVGPRLAAWLRPGDRVLFKGSRGARVERVLEAVRAALSSSPARTEPVGDRAGEGS